MTNSDNPELELLTHNPENRLLFLFILFLLN